ncbi:hypothetical protein MHYP_G00000620 [Metynnis hypsauchen]
MSAVTSRLSRQQEKKLRSMLGCSRLGLLFKASVHGYSGAAFHRKCDRQGPTVTVAYNQAGYVFGAYTSRDYAQTNQMQQPKVAFSASLSALEFGHMNIGPYPNQVTLVYQNAFTNIGSAYDPNTGIFTAPVRGVYYFSFVVFNPYDLSTGLSLMKNGQHVVSVSDNPPGVDTEDTASNAASLLLEKGDQVCVQLMQNRKVYSDKFKRNTFSGHLLYGM